jgi:cellulose synthase/poly-beta-1,6-N-acetylglucosamine synthase-like glycosyltransferase
MWLLTFMLGLLTLTLAWTCFGYFLLVFAMAVLRGRPAAASAPTAWPSLSVLVPCRDEAPWIAAKCADVAAQAYPGELEVIFIDGGSKDGTAEMLAGLVRDRPGFRVLRSAAPKVNQLNVGLAHARGDLIVCTDVDAALEKDCLRNLAAEFVAHPDAWAVGAYSRPEDCSKEERWYWASLSRARLMESDAQTASMVFGPCFGFRRELLDRFPGDVIADDVYVAMKANADGHRTIYSREARAIELRCPRSLAEFLPHKFRKSNAFLRETLRFLYRLPEMPGFVKVTVVTQLAQQLLLPWNLGLWLVCCGALLTLFRLDLVAMAVFFLLAVLVATSRAFAHVRLPGAEPFGSPRLLLSVFVLTNLVLLASGVSYAFYRRDETSGRFVPRGPRRSPEKEPFLPPPALEPPVPEGASLLASGTADRETARGGPTL